jgi:hypothetical protein
MGAEVYFRQRIAAFVESLLPVADGDLILFAEMARRAAAKGYRWADLSLTSACAEHLFGGKCHSERVGQPTPVTASLQRRVSVPGFAGTCPERNEGFFAVLAGFRKVRYGTAQNDTEKAACFCTRSWRRFGGSHLSRARRLPRGVAKGLQSACPPPGG